MAQIFISYAREDFQHARELYHRLQAQGFRPWMDKVDLLAGQAWQPALERAMRESDFFVLLLSRNSVKKRGFVQREIRTALDLWEEKLAEDIFLIPIMLEAMTWEEVPEAISRFQWVEPYEDDGWERLARSLAHGIVQRGIQPKAPVVQPGPTPRVEPPVTTLPATTRPITPPPKPKPAVPDIIVLAAQFTENLNGVPLDMILVPGGKFLMGSPPETGSNSERPQHEVIVPAFYCGKYQVTQAQWQAVMGNNPSYFKGDLQRPVEMVSWEDAQAFCKKLNALTGKTYRLPTEAEWEYACRAGTTGDYAGELEAMAWYGDNSGRQLINSLGIWNEGVDKYGERLQQNGNQTQVVGRKQANTFGLYDMHGNVWEWCEDVWHKDYQDAPTDGSAWLSGGDLSYRVLRGGSFNAYAAFVRSAIRFGLAPGDRLYAFGFRVVVSARTP